MNRAFLILSLILALPVFANGNTVQSGVAIASDVPAGKPYVYKQSAGEPREMEVFFSPPDQDHGLLSGQPTLKFNPLIQ